MSLRDYVVYVNRQIGRETDAVFDALFDGIEWVAPFTPWIALITLIASAVVLWFGL